MNRIVVCSVVPFGLNGQLIGNRLIPKMSPTQMNDLPSSSMELRQQSFVLVCLIVQDFESLGWSLAHCCPQLHVRDRVRPQQPSRPDTPQMLPTSGEELTVTCNLGVIVEQINQPGAARSRLGIDQKTPSGHSQHRDTGRGKRDGRGFGSQRYCGGVDLTQLFYGHWHKNGGGVSSGQNDQPSLCGAVPPRPTRYGRLPCSRSGRRTNRPANRA